LATHIIANLGISCQVFLPKEGALPFVKGIHLLPGVSLWGSPPLSNPIGGKIKSVKEKERVWAELRAPFPEEDSAEGHLGAPGRKALIRRLNQVLGVDGWEEEYRFLHSERLPNGDRLVEVECALKILGVTHRDVGWGRSAEEAYAKAFQRVAEKFGIGLKDTSSGEEKEAVSPPKEASPAPDDLAERLQKGDALVAKMVESLKRAGKGREAIKVLLEYGYKVGDPGSTEADLEKLRKIYRRLSEIAKKGELKEEAFAG
jgi:hypothetical protein